MRTTSHLSRPASAGAALLGLALLSACQTDPSATAGGSGGTGTVDPAVVEAVDAASAEQTEWARPAELASPPQGQKIVAITCGAQGYGCVQGAQGVSAAGDVLGWDVQVVDGKGDPSVWNAAVVQAVTDGADGIVLSAINPALVQDGLARAEAAGVPVIVQFLPPAGETTVDGYVSTDHVAGGKILADWIIADSGGRAQVLMLDEPAFPELVARGDAIRAELEAACPDCTVVEEAQFSIGTMAQQLSGLVTTALQSNPGIGYVVAPFDSSATFAAQGVRQAGRTDVVLVSGEGNPDGLARVRGGEQSADLATVPAWAGWVAVDQLARLFTDQPVEDHILIPQRLFTESNVPSGDGGWAGDVDYAAEFRAAWGK